jgi:tRNA (guanine37-N1)-methyltransferase
MRIDILTIFPSLFDSFLGESLLAKAIEKKIIDIRVHDLRGWSKDRHRKVDDAPFGGGGGMVMTPQPIADALEELSKEGDALKILLSPRGKLFTQKKARELSRVDRITLVCGRYEGVDERIARHYVDEEISIGDYILNGGEVAAMALVESLFRLLPGAIGKEESLAAESFEEGLLEYPQYTRPAEFRGHRVPEILLSGHHAKIKSWRREKSLEVTKAVRPEFLEKPAGEKPVRRNDIKFSMALVHYPVVGKSGETMVSSITTLDIHDMARIGKTYGAQAVYIVTPVVDQKLMVERIKGHWLDDEALKEAGGRRIKALSLIKVAPSVEEAVADAKKRAKVVKLLATSAAGGDDCLSPDEFLAASAAGAADEWLILFGTAYGLAPELIKKAEARIAPVIGKGEFNHLPVRAASAIILDRLFGK